MKLLEAMMAGLMGEVDKHEGGWNGLRALDESMTWVRPTHQRTACSQRRPWTDLDRQLMDLYARYERPCLED